jgi:cell division protein FtsB
MQYPACHTIQDVAEQSANCQGNPLWHIEILAGEILLMNKLIRGLEAQLKELRNERQVEKAAA